MEKAFAEGDGPAFLAWGGIGVDGDLERELVFGGDGDALDFGRIEASAEGDGGFDEDFFGAVVREDGSFGHGGLGDWGLGHGCLGGWGWVGGGDRWEIGWEIFGGKGLGTGDGFHFSIVTCCVARQNRSSLAAWVKSEAQKTPRRPLGDSQEIPRRLPGIPKRHCVN